jgi:hypothetical protein
LAVLMGKLRSLPPTTRSRVRESLLHFTPETILKWHRELVRRKWTCRRQRSPGRPPISDAVEQLILRLARENPRWGYRRITGALAKLGQQVGRSTIAAILKRQRLPPAPTRGQGSTSWRSWYRHYRQQVLACDFFTQESLLLQTNFVLFFIEVRTRKVYLAGCTRHPTAAWVTQQARHLAWQLQDGTLPVRVLLHDRDVKFPPSFDAVFRCGLACSVAGRSPCHLIIDFALCCILRNRGPTPQLGCFRFTQAQEALGFCVLASLVVVSVANYCALLYYYHECNRHYWECESRCAGS